MADLIRKAVDVVYGDDIGDIRIMGEEIANYQIYPELAITLDELRRRKKWMYEVKLTSRAQRDVDKLSSINWDRVQVVLDRIEC